jgi:MtfA peptidase
MGPDSMPFTFLRKWKRKRILRKPFPPTWEPHLRGLPFFLELNGEEQDKLRGMVQVFLAEKQFEGCGGLTLDNGIRVGIAAQACLLVLHLDHDWYHRVRTILVYPTSFRSNFAETGPGGVVGPPSAAAHAGEAWLGGEVILAWDSAFTGGRDGSDGRNPVFHEFAHKLDMLDGYADGTPPLASREQAEAWRIIATESFQTLRAQAEARQRTLIDAYGASNPAEFFAVASEVFFEQAPQLKSQEPALYDQLRRFYRQDPALRRDGTSKQV